MLVVLQVERYPLLTGRRFLEFRPQEEHEVQHRSLGFCVGGTARGMLLGRTTMSIGEAEVSNGRSVSREPVICTSYSIWQQYTPFETGHSGESTKGAST